MKRVMAMEITKGKVLETFMRHYNRLQGLPEMRRLMEADGATLDELAPAGTSREMLAQILDEILTEDFGLKKGETSKLTPFEEEVSKIGFAAAEIFLDHSANLVPPFPFDTRDGGDVAEWDKKARAMALDFVPKEQLLDKPWTKAFIQAFVGKLFMHQRDHR